MSRASRRRFAIGRPSSAVFASMAAALFLAASGAAEPERILAASGAAEPERILAASGAAEPERILASVEELYRGIHTVGARINGRGDRVVVMRYMTTGRSGRNTKLSFELREIGGAGRAIELFGRGCKQDEPCAPDVLRWASDDILIAGWLDSFDRRTQLPIVSYSIVEFTDEDDFFAHRSTDAVDAGFIVDFLPNDPDAILFQPANMPGSVFRMAPHRLIRDVPGWRAIKSGEAVPGVELAARLEESVVRWIPDRHGNVRAALTVAADPLALRIWLRDSIDSPWRVVRTETRQKHFGDLFPLAFSRDGGRLVVWSALDAERYGLYEYHPETNEIGALVYAHPSGRIDDVEFDPISGDLLSATYREEGEVRQVHFDPVDPVLKQALAGAFSASAALVTSRSRDGRKVTVEATSQDDPGAYWLLDIETLGATELARIRPWLDNNRLAEARVFRVRSDGGPEVEAFLTLPPTDVETPPMIVMPHGGPIGVADSRLFHPDIQYLARMGYAVLQVNYRGSGNAGRSFREAGNRQWGRGIEDDIEAAIDHAIEQGWVDGDRVCTTGASYGGYSALMLVVRRPEAYRCASSIMGVTDIPLMFNADDLFMATGAAERMIEIVGDPEKDYEEQIRVSPVYNAAAIRVPVLLAHGALDTRVDYDHMVRMKLALQLEGTPVRTIELRRSGHGFATKASRIAYYRALSDFMKKHLSP